MVGRKSKVLVRGLGFRRIPDVSCGQQIACIDPSSLQWQWKYPLETSRESVRKYGKVGGPNISLITDRLFVYPGNSIQFSEDTFQLFTACQWEGESQGEFKFGKHSLETQWLMVLVGGYLRSGKVVDDGIVINDFQEQEVQAATELNFDWAVCGSLDIKLPNILKWFFQLFGTVDRKILTKVKKLSPSYLKLIWRPMIDTEVHSERFVADLTEIVMKSGYTPVWSNNKLYTENRMVSEASATMVQKPTVLYSIRFDENCPALIADQQKFAFTPTGR